MRLHKQIRRGMAVTSIDGVHMGRVIDVTTDGIIIEKDTLRREDSEHHAGTANGTVGVAGFAAPPPHGGLGLEPTDLTQARMDSAKFQNHGQYMPLPHEPSMTERRAAGPGWDPLSVDEEEPAKEAPRTSGPDTEPPTRY